MCTPIKDHNSFAQLDVMRPMRISDASNERRITLWSLGTNAGKEGRPNREKNLCNTNTYTNRREFRNDSNLWSIFRPMIKPPLPARSMCPRFHTYLLPWTPDKHTTGRSSTQAKEASVPELILHLRQARPFQTETHLPSPTFSSGAKSSFREVRHVVSFICSDSVFFHP